MPTLIMIKAGEFQFAAEFNDSPTAIAIADALPLSGSVNQWGGELYFHAPVSADLEPDSREVLKAGELAYWPPGKMFCIFFGSTPASIGNDIRAASNVNVVGRITSDLTELWNISDGEKITVRISCYPERVGVEPHPRP
jgi:hypothetical protein